MKKYLIYLMMAAAVVMKTMNPKHRESRLPRIPTIRKILKNRAMAPILRAATAKFWLPISVGAAQPNVWHRKSSVRQEQTSSVLSR